MKPFGYYDLIEALPAPGCALCRLLEKDLRQYLDLLLFEYAMDFDVHGAFRAAHGLCSVHSADLLTFHMGATSIAALYGGVIETALAALDDALEAGERGAFRFGRRRTGGAEAAAALDAAGACAACASLNVREADYAQIAAEGMDDPDFRAAFDASEGFCLPHVRAVLRRAPPSAARHILTVQRRLWAGLRADLNMFMAKQDPRFGAAPDEREARSWRRALLTAAGVAGVFGLRGR